MIKQTIYFEKPTYLSLKYEQLIIKQTNENGEEQEYSRPIEDIAMIILDHPQISLSQKVMSFLTTNNVAIVVCNEKRHPIGLMMPLESNTLQSKRFQTQIEVSEALKKNLWQQTIIAKIENQANLLAKRKIKNEPLIRWAKEVNSGDTNNVEAKAANYYWSNLFNNVTDFKRGQDEDAPNNLLNYGYAILRATVARALVGSGLLPTLGIHHKNKYNAYCLADDIMEPFRPFVDELVCQIIDTEPIENFTQLTTKHKAALLKINAIDILLEKETRPLMVGLQRTTATLVSCYEGKARKIIYPKMI